MDADIPEERAAFIFSDPAGRRWPRLRLTLLFGGIAAFVATIFFVQTLFITPQLHLPFSLRQLKGQLKSLQKKNPAGQLPPAFRSGKNSSPRERPPTKHRRQPER